MLDLSKKIEKPYEIKMFDGTILQIRKPSQEMLLDLVRLQDNSEDMVVALEQFGKTLLKILNRNQNGKLYTEAILDEFSIDMITAVIQDYLSYSLSLLGE